MKRGFAEITEEEWGSVPHSFKPSRALNPPPIESFSYGRNLQPGTSAPGGGGGAGSFEDDDDDDMELRRPARTLPSSRSRRLIVDDDDEEDGGGVGRPAEGNAESDEDLIEVFDIKSSDGEDDGEELRRGKTRALTELEKNKEEGGGWVDDSEDDDVLEGDDEDQDDIFSNGDGGSSGRIGDVVGKALQKCSKISTDLKKELYGSSFAACDQYSEVEAASNRIVNQDDIDAACGSEDSDFRPLLKPYQLVGVNFLLLLHRKGIGGGIRTISQTLPDSY